MSSSFPFVSCTQPKTADFQSRISVFALELGAHSAAKIVMQSVWWSCKVYIIHKVSKIK